MNERTLPGLGLVGFWPLGADGWKDEMDANLRTLSGVAQLSVISRTTSLPGSPTDGMVYIVPDDAPSFGGQIAIRDDGVWVYLTPTNGMRAWVQDQKEIFVRDGSSWVGIQTNFPRFQVICNYDAYVPADTWTKVPFNNQQHDVQAVFNVGTNVFTAPMNGVFKLGSKVNYKWNDSLDDGPFDPTTSELNIQLYRNGSAVPATLVRNRSGMGLVGQSVQTEALLSLDEGDEIEVRVFMADVGGYIEENTNLFYGFRVA